MTTEIEWSPDFCLVCDRQISEGAYCSQACRLAELEKGRSSEPATPGLHFSTSASSTSSYASSTLVNPSGFYLPPAVNFTAYKAPTRLDSPPASPGYRSSANGSSYFNQPSSSQAPADNGPKRSLSPSSSRSSLSSMSMTSSQSNQGLSAQAADELRGYMSAFDHVRDIKRRLTLA